MASEGLFGVTVTTTKVPSRTTKDMATVSLLKLMALSKKAIGNMVYFPTIELKVIKHNLYIFFMSIKQIFYKKKV